ncbi:MAG: FlgD immunoglobulin-like domain containing protein [Candidatus Krumholzibacteria bacterium]|jgi:hypothetical protein|nr:FlgD immunoglobulin-like domain containing protein [Candidatus Krumholzibacteria bacterium]
MKRISIHLACSFLVLVSLPVSAHAPIHSPWPWDDGERYDNTWFKDFMMDAPWRVIDEDTPIPLTVILKDCDMDDIRELHWIECIDTSTGARIWFHDFNDERIGNNASEDNYWTWITTVTENHDWLPNGTLLTPANLGYGTGDRIPLRVEIYYKDDWFNYSETRHLRIEVGSGPFPWPANWFGGDVHYHTMYTNNIAEYGAPIPAVKRAAKAAGVHWLCVTDHSCDLDETGDGSFSYGTDEWEYTIQDENGIHEHYRDVSSLGGSWESIQFDIDQEMDPGFRLYRGVEINLASVDESSWDKTMHTLFYNPSYIHSPNSGAFGERPVYPNLPDGLAALDPGGFAYAAHPKSSLSAEWGGTDWGVNGTEWGLVNLGTALGYEGFRGIQAFNTRNLYESYDQYNPWGDFNAGNAADNPYPNELNQGLDLWDTLLQSHLSQDPPRKVFFAGGSDAHGDFNYSTHIGIDNYATDSAIGKVQTVAYCPGSWGPGNLPPVEEIMEAYRAGRTVSTDGPFLEIGLDRDDDGDWYEEGDLMIGDSGSVNNGLPLPLKIRWSSLPEFGEVDRVTVYAGDSGGLQEILQLYPSAGEAYAGSSSLDLNGFSFEGWHYLRAELLTEDGEAGHRAYTNPIWMFFDSATDVANSLPGFRLEQNWPNPFNPSTEIVFHLSKESIASLEILDASGLLVRSLVQELLPQGEYRYRWDGRDFRGRAVSSGIYFSRLRLGDRELSRKMLLLK